MGEGDLRIGESRVLATPASEHAASFAYFKPGNERECQLAPTFVCGSIAVGNSRVENNPTGGAKSVSWQMLSVPQE